MAGKEPLTVAWGRSETNSKLTKLPGGVRPNDKELCGSAK
jgi:hypothetical protein